jgi:hypothetical protein
MEPPARCCRLEKVLEKVLKRELLRRRSRTALTIR